jgi:hypothetical protein
MSVSISTRSFVSSIHSLGSRHHGPQRAMRVGELWGQRRWTWTGDFKCREAKTGFYRNRSMQTGSSGTLIGWKSGQTTFVPLWDWREGAWLRTQAVLQQQRKRWVRTIIAKTHVYTCRFFRVRTSKKFVPHRNQLQAWSFWMISRWGMDEL